jgi:hypothetical protein
MTLMSPAARTAAAAVTAMLVTGALMMAGCARGGHAAAGGHPAPRPVPSLTTPVYSGTITIVARNGSRPRCRAPATIRSGTWYWVIQTGNAPVSFTIPGVPRASRPIRRTATYTESSLYASASGTYHLVIKPLPAAPCQFTVR